MTKPESSRNANSEESEEIHLISEINSSNEAESRVEAESPTASPQTAKQFIKNFIASDPLASGDEDDGKESNLKKEEYEPAAKKPKDNGKKYTPKYKKEWENKPELKSWLSESIHGNTYFYCKFCKKDYRCGISDINKHMSSKKHMLKATMPAFRAQKFKFRGLLCPVFTPFVNIKKIAPEVDFKAVPKYANFLNACNIKGILINDIAGEGMSLTIRERMDITNCWVEACEKNNQFLMVQIGGAPLKDVIEMAKHASKKDVGAIVILPDLYTKPKNHIDLIKYIKLISEFTKNIPILYHHNPAYTQVDFDVPTFLIDITGEIDSFVGLIYTTNDIQKSTAALHVNKDKFTIFIGTDEAILAAAATGFTCIMGASINFLPKLVESIYDSVREGNIKSAQMSQNLLNKTIDAISKEGDPIAVFKAATNIITNTCGTMTREPLPNLWESMLKKIQTKLHELGLM